MVGLRGVARRVVAAAAFFCLALFAPAAHASADPVTVDIPEGLPIVVIGSSTQIKLTTWERPVLMVDSGGDTPMIERRSQRRVGIGVPQGEGPVPVTVPAMTFTTPEGPIQMPAEDFVVTVPVGTKELVRVELPPGASAISVPANTPLLYVRTGNAVSIDDYHGQLIASTRGGQMLLHNVGGDVFLENWRGSILIGDSAFNRIRARSGLRNILFRGCRAKQIEVSSIRGSLVYDGGAFDPGLAHFETQSGVAAIGIGTGGAQIGVHGLSSGHFFSSFEQPVSLNQAGPEATAIIRGGGPLVNVTSHEGLVYLYDGSLVTRRQIPLDWVELRRAVRGADHLMTAPRAPFVPGALMRNPFAPAGASPGQPQAAVPVAPEIRTDAAATAAAPAPTSTGRPAQSRAKARQLAPAKPRRFL